MGPGRWRGGLAAGDHRQRVLLVVAGVAALLVGGVGGQQHRVGVGQCRPCVLVAPVRVVVGADRGVNVGARQRESLCSGVDRPGVGVALGAAAGVVVGVGP